MKWQDWRGSFDGRAVMLTKTLAQFCGCKIDLHKFIDADDPGCFHTHPAFAVRIILRGGYIEQLLDGSTRHWRAGDIGLVRPQLAHRVMWLIGRGPAYSLWLRGPKVAKISLVGDGWPAEHRSHDRPGAT